MQADIGTRILGHRRLQERAVGVELDREQVGHLQNPRLLAEVLADTLLLGEGVRHQITSMLARHLRSTGRACANPVLPGTTVDNTVGKIT